MDVGFFFYTNAESIAFVVVIALDRYVRGRPLNSGCQHIHLKEKYGDQFSEGSGKPLLVLYQVQPISEPVLNC